MMILDLLKDSHIFSVELSEDHTHLSIAQGYASYCDISLDREQVLDLIIELEAIAIKMVNDGRM